MKRPPRQRVLPSPGKARLHPDDGMSRENYGPLVDQPWKSPWQDALSTFSIDVDTASYTNVRRMILDGRSVPPDAVRIEELVNYFDYQYGGPRGEGPFAVHGNLATCPWKPQHLLARVAIKGREVDAKARPASNLVFLIDVSGSMQDPLKLPLLKRSMRVLLDQLDERDRVGMVVYAGSEGVVLDPTVLDERGLSAAIQALEKLEAGGSTNGGAGIKRAYEMAAKHLVPGGVNRVILATDGDFNVGTTGQGDLVSLVKKGATSGVNLSVIGFGTGNLNDAMMEAITNHGNGNYFYIDGDHEARRVFLQKLTGTLVTIAKDVKIQVEFNPGKVQAYRLIGYANRILRHEDFANDKVDAGDIGAGHTVTAFYEIVPQGVAMPDTGSVDASRYQKPAERDLVASDDWFTLKLRHKHPEGEVSALIETPVKGEPVAWEQAGNDFRFASAVALCGMKLRQMPEMADVAWTKVMEIARPALAEDPQEQRVEFVEMVARHAKIPVPSFEPVASASPLDDLGFVLMESTIWYMAFGIESGGKWAPKLVGITADREKFQNRVPATDMLAPGDIFFLDGAMAGRFRFLGIVEQDVTSKRTLLTQKVKFAQYEDLSANKRGQRYESQYGLPEAAYMAAASHDRTGVLELAVKGSSSLKFKVEEGAKFALPPDAAEKSYLLKEVTEDRIVIEYPTPTGAQTREIPRNPDR
jgi:Ca-activated chloride channel family protein